MDVNIDDDILFGPAERLFSGDAPTADQLAAAYNMFEAVRMIYGGFSQFDHAPYLHKRFLAEALGVLIKSGLQHYQTNAYRGLPAGLPEAFVDKIRKAKVPRGF